MSRLSRLLSLVVVAVSGAGCVRRTNPKHFAKVDPSTETCARCATGDGDTGPLLESVVETWPLCSDQVEWIAIGSEGWQTQYGDTYGAVAGR